MPALTRRAPQSNSRNVRRRTNAPKKFTRGVSRIPRAISTRGTPNGYYEIPVRTLLKVYGNNGQGFFQTNQNSSSAPSGVGFQGFGLWTSLDLVTMYLGEGTVSAQIQRSVPGFSEIARVFDQCKIASMSVDVWFETQTGSAQQQNTTNFGSPDLYVVQDKDDVLPPASIDDILQYQKVQRMPGASYRTYKNKCYPYVKDVNGTSGEEGVTTTTILESSSAGYMNTSKPAAAHMGWKEFVAVDATGGQKPFMMNVLVTQVRIYKITNCWKLQFSSSDAARPPYIKAICC